MSTATPMDPEDRTMHYRRQRGQRPGHLCVALTPRQRRRDAQKQHAWDCPECHGTGEVWVNACTCGAGPGSYAGMHERYCGTEMCPAGCWDRLNPPEVLS